MINKQTFERLRELVRGQYENARTDAEGSPSQQADVTVKYVQHDQDIDELEQMWQANNNSNRR